MQVRCDPTTRLILDGFDPGQGRGFALCDKHDFMAGVSAQKACEMQVLTGGILMDEQDFHGGGN